MEIVVLNPLGRPIGKLCDSSEIQNDAWMHREDLKGYPAELFFSIFCSFKAGIALNDNKYLYL